MAPVQAIVVPSTIVWMLKELCVQHLLRRDQQDWIEMVHVSMMLKLFLLEWWQPCCLQMSSIFLVDPVSMLVQWKNLSKIRLINFQVVCH